MANLHQQYLLDKVNWGVNGVAECLSSIAVIDTGTHCASPSSAREITNKAVPKAQVTLECQSPLSYVWHFWFQPRPHSRETHAFFFPLRLRESRWSVSHHHTMFDTLKIRI